MYFLFRLSLNKTNGMLQMSQSRDTKRTPLAILLFSFLSSVLLFLSIIWILEKMWLSCAWNRKAGNGFRNTCTPLNSFSANALFSFFKQIEEITLPSVPTLHSLVSSVVCSMLLNCFLKFFHFASLGGLLYAASTFYTLANKTRYWLIPIEEISNLCSHSGLIPVQPGCIL